MIKCDACGAMIDPKGFLKRHRVEGELEIDAFACGKCGKEYIGFISNREMRGKIREIQSQQRVIRMMIQNKMREKSIRKARKKLDDMKKSALKLEAELKRRYEEGKIHEQKAAAGDLPENPSGLPDHPDGGDPAHAVSGDGAGKNRAGEGLE